MSKRTLQLICFAITCLFVGPSFADSIVITDSKFKYNGVSYFRGKSENVDLASYGDKKTPVGKVNYLAVQNNVKREHVAKVSVKITGPYAIDWSKYTDADVNADIAYLTASGTAGFSRSAAKSANLKLVKLALHEGPLKKLLNQHANGARNYLADEGSSGRVVSEVWVVSEAQLAEDITRCGSVSGAGSKGAIKITMDLNKCTNVQSSVEVPSMTTFAYLLHKVKKWNKDKTKVEDLEDDSSGVT